MINKVVKIYLAGGMRSGWQDHVMKVVRQQFPKLPIMFLDPRQHGANDEQVYTAWDLEGVRIADILFVYVEKDNPAGHGACLEIGYAQGLNTGKRIVSVFEQDHPQYRYFGMARVASDFHFDNFQDGLGTLISVIATIYRDM